MIRAFDCITQMGSRNEWVYVCVRDGGEFAQCMCTIESVGASSECAVLGFVSVDYVI